MLVKYKKRAPARMRQGMRVAMSDSLTVIAIGVTFGSATRNPSGFPHMTDDFDIDAGEARDGGIKELAEEWLDL